jgi:trimeric autotransporter adhesin
VPGLDFILKLRPVTYNMNVEAMDNPNGPQFASYTTSLNTISEKYRQASSIRRTGFIAQEVQAAAEASGFDFDGVIVPKTENEHYALSYSSFVMPLVKAVQQQQAIIDTLTQKDKERQQQLEELLKEFKSLKEKLH